MNKKQFILLVGLPGSGKTTWFEKYKESNPETVRCSSDMYIEEVAKAQGKFYRDVFCFTVSDASKKFNQDKQFYLQKKYDTIVIDRTSLLIPSRNSLITGVNREVYDVKAVVFDTLWETILKRNQDRVKQGRDIPVSVLTEMWETKQIDLQKDFTRFDSVEVIK